MFTRPEAHNLLHLVLVVFGVTMLAIAYVDWVDHPLTLWVELP